MGDASFLEPIQQSIRAQFPQLDIDLQKAIDTLKRLQSITGSMVDQAAAPVRLDLRTANGQHSLDSDTTSPQFIPLLKGAEGQVIPSSGPPRIFEAGESFGNYQISRSLGKGAMGAVYLAYDAQLHRYVALKTPFLGDKPLVVQRFLREARSAAQIRSPYVCPIYEVGQVSGIFYLTMAFIEGRSLDRWIKDERHSIDEICALFRKVLLGINKAHSHNIIHRDLKPDNIMIDADNEPIIMDFGLARRVDEDISSTVAGSLLGTPAYMSPEQASGDHARVGLQSDLYSLGVVLYEMLTGTLPFKGSLVVVLQKILKEEPAPPSKYLPGLAPGSPVERVCMKLMAKKLEDRFRNASEVLAILSPQTGNSAPTPTVQRPSLFRSVWQKSEKLFATMTGQAAPPAPGKSAESGDDAATLNPEAPVPGTNIAVVHAGETATITHDMTLPEDEKKIPGTNASILAGSSW
jgi:serine/threonine protein kinase